MKSEAGQIILILVLVMTVALAIGLSVIQRSLSDVSTSTKVEQSSRAFSAAEAGIEKAIQSGLPVVDFSLENNSLIREAKIDGIPISGNALEDSLYKEEMIQVWLADPTENLPTCNAPKVCYTEPSFDVYFGKVDTTDKPALEVTVVSWDGTKYVSTKKFFDSDATRADANGFAKATCTNNFSIFTNANSGPGSESNFYCKTSVSGYQYASPAKAILVRLRLLYSSLRQPVAVAPSSGSLPVQAKIYKSIGISGQTQRKIQVIRYNYVVPGYFDFAIFSSGDINK